MARTGGRAPATRCGHQVPLDAHPAVLAVKPAPRRSEAAVARCVPRLRARGQGQGRTADLPLFRRTLVPTELPARAALTIPESNRCVRIVSSTLVAAPGPHR